MDDLVRQLEKAFEWSNDPMLSEAADEITALRARLAEVERERDAAIVALSEQARKRGEAEGRLQASELPGIVEGWKSRAERAEAALATARRDAYEEAAKICDKVVSDMIYFNDSARKKDKIFADRIRALANEAET